MSQYFDSIKVRLEQTLKLTIYIPFRYFNSIKVRLELMVTSLPLMVLTDFNSIKVRLELISSTQKALLKIIFQFHKGTIRTADCKSACDISSISIP